MSFLGKVYKSQKHENLEEFFKAIDSTGTPEAHIATMLQSEPITKLTKNGDSYTLTNTGTRNTEITFTNGGKVVEKYDENVTFTSTFILDGNVLTQKQNSNDGKIAITVTREFSEDSLKEKITAAGWDGVAYRYFKV